MTVSTDGNEGADNSSANNDEEEQEQEDGITIVSTGVASNFGALSSLSSREGDDEIHCDKSQLHEEEEEERQLLLSSIITTEPRGANTSSPYPPAWQHHHLPGASSILSLSTTESMYQVEAQEQAHAASNASLANAKLLESSIAMSVSSADSSDDNGLLSLDPSSVRSSQLGQLPSVASQERSNHSGVPGSNLPPIETTRHASEIMQIENNQESQSMTSRDDSNGSEVPEWFASIETEQNWEIWRSEMLDVLAILGEHGDQEDFVVDQAAVDPDWLLAALLSQQPDLLVLMQNRQQVESRNTFWKKVAAVVASAVVPVIAVAMVAGNRRLRV